MKAFILSIIVAISAFFGNKNNVVQQLPIEVSVSTESADITITPRELVATSSSTIKKTVPISPIKILKPTTSITEEVLRKFFNMTEKASIDRILGSESLLSEYDKYFYAKFQKFPVPRITITDLKQQIVIPRDAGGKFIPVVCLGEQLKKVYSEIEKAEKETEFLQMDYDCHRGNKVETQECRDWRRDNDQTREQRLSVYGECHGLAGSPLLFCVQDVRRKIEKDRFNELTGRYCLGN